MKMSELTKALVEAQRSAKAVEKESQNTFHCYKYASTESIIEEARGALSHAGLAFSCVESKLESGRGCRILICSYRLEHVSGETRAYQSFTPISEEKGRPLDKAVAIAKTYDFGYTLRGLLLLPRVEEGTDADQRDDRKHQPQRRMQVQVTSDGEVLEESAAVSVPQGVGKLTDEELMMLMDAFLQAKTLPALRKVAAEVRTFYEVGRMTDEQKGACEKLLRNQEAKIKAMRKEDKDMSHMQGDPDEPFPY